MERVPKYGLLNYFRKTVEPLEDNEAQAYLNGRAPLWLGEALVVKSLTGTWNAV